MHTTVAEIARRVAGRVDGDGDTVLTGLDEIRQARPGTLTFAGGPYLRYVQSTQASAVLVPEDCPAAKPVLIRVPNPDAAFAKVAAAFCAPPAQPQPGIHPVACIDPAAQTGPNLSAGPGAYVGPGAVLGARVVLHANAVVEADAQVGDDTIIYANATVGAGVKIGARCILHPGSVVGSDGFGFTFEDGRHKKVPQAGTVDVGDDVEIGANSCIDRARFGTTAVGEGTKIDNLVQVGHNVRIGKHCILCGGSGVAGSAILGDYVTLAAGAGVSGHLEVGDRVTVAALGGVTKSIPPGLTVSGFPAIEHSQEQRLKAGLRMLPKSLKTLRALEQRIEQLENLLDGREAKNDS